MKTTLLDALQKEFLNSFFSSFLAEDFFLTGGTALSEFYLHHRISVDLDLFTINQKIGFDTVNAEILKIANTLKLSIVHQVSSPTYLEYIFNKEGKTLKVDLVKDVPLHFGTIKKLKSIQIDSLENIAAGKLLALFGRADAKDFIDLYFLLEIEKKIKFETVFSLAKKKDQGLHELYLAEMLSHLNTITLFPQTIKPYKKSEMARFFALLSKNLLTKIQPK